MSDDGVDSFVSSEYIARASASRLLVAITLHFASNRLGYLEKVLQSIASFPVQGRNVVIFTNTENLAEQNEIRQIFGMAGLTDGRDVRLEVVQGLPHPYELTWAHKKLISDSFVAPGSTYSHFVYLEDDEELGFENLVYFIAGREILRSFGLIPAFLRVEWNANRRCHVNVDNTGPIDLTIRPFVSDGSYAFIEADHPYSGSFILDQELAQEYVASHSFDLMRSRRVSAWNVRERAAMGLTFEIPPAPFVYRVVVPISIFSHSAPKCAWLTHLPDSYTNNPKTPFGKMAMTALFTGDLCLPAKPPASAIEGASYKLHTVGKGSARNTLKRVVRFYSIQKSMIKLILKRIFRSRR